MTPNAEYKQSIENRIRKLEDFINERCLNDNEMYASYQRDLGYLHCLRDILSYGEPSKLILDRISTTLNKMEKANE